MDLVHDRGSMDLVQRGGPWTPGPCFVLTREKRLHRLITGKPRSGNIAYITERIIGQGSYGNSLNAKKFG